MRAFTYCSFADDSGCLGIVILVGAFTPAGASVCTHALGLNPGGELVAVSCNENEPDVPPHIFEAMAANVHRLIPVDEARVLFGARSIREHEAN